MSLIVLLGGVSKAEFDRTVADLNARLTRIAEVAAEASETADVALAATARLIRDVDELTARVTALEQEQPVPEPEPRKPVVIALAHTFDGAGWAIRTEHVEATAAPTPPVYDAATLGLPAGSWGVMTRVWSPSKSGDAFWATIATPGVSTPPMRRFATEHGTWTLVNIGEFILAEPADVTLAMAPAETGLLADVLILIPEGFDGDLDELLPAPPIIDRPAPGPDPEPEPEPIPAGAWPLTIRPYDGTFRNGRVMTSEDRGIYEGILDYWATTGNAAAIASLRSGNAYSIGRGAPASSIVSLEILTRLIGDARLVDLQAELGLAAIAGMRTTWAPGTDIPPQWDRDPHGERFLPWLKDRDEKRLYGQDFHLSDAPKSWSMLARIAATLHANRDQASPAGYDYAAMADTWRALLAGYEKVWSMVDDAAFAPEARVPAIYKGRWIPGSYRRCKGDTDWPTNMRAETHSNWSCAALALHMGHALGKPEHQARAGIDLYVHSFMTAEQGITDDDTGYGPGLMFSRSASAWTTSSDYECPTNYAEQVVPDAISLHLALGDASHVTQDFLQRFARNVAGWLLKGTPANFSVKNGVAGMASRWYTTPAGERRKIPDASHSTSSGAADRTDDQYAGYGLQLLLPWDVPSGKLREYGTAAWLRFKETSAGGLNRPKDLYLPTGLLLASATA